MMIGEKDLSRMPGHLQRLFVKLDNPSRAEMLVAFPRKSGGGDKRQGATGQRDGGFGNVGAGGSSGGNNAPAYADSGSAARFFYSAKADADDRLNSKHPTVKPLDLMRWLVRLVTPKGGVCLDPFAGTGTTGHAALIEGCRAVLIEREAEYVEDITRRMGLVHSGRDERARKLAKVETEHGLPLFGGASV